MSPHQEKIIFSFIIVNWNRAQDLYELLTSIERQKKKIFEVIVVDNASTDESVNLISEMFPKVDLVKLKSNCGVTGFNIGVNKAKGRFSVLLDNDTILPDSFIDDMEKTVLSYPEVSVFAFNILSPNHGRQNDYLPQNANEPILWHNFIGGGVAFTTSCYKKIGGYNPKYFIYINETELSARLLLNGYKILFCPNLKIIHKTSSVARITSFNYLYFIRNSILFIKTYFRFVTKVDLLFGFMLINFKYAGMNSLLRTYFKGIISGLSTFPYYRCTEKLSRHIEKKFVNSWQGNPSFTNILRKKLFKEF